MMLHTTILVVVLLLIGGVIPCSAVQPAKPNFKWLNDGSDSIYITNQVSDGSTLARVSLIIVITPPLNILSLFWLRD